MKSGNHVLTNSILVLLIIGYFFIILPFSIDFWSEFRFAYSMLILAFPIGIFQIFRRLQDEKGFKIEINKNTTRISNSSTNYQETELINAEISKLKLAENNLKIKLLLYSKNKMPIEILSEKFERIQKNEVFDYVHLIKKKLDKKLGL